MVSGIERYTRRGSILMLAMFLLCLPQPVALATDSDTQLWAPVTLNLPMGKRWYSSLEVQPRLAENISELSVIRIRPSLTYKLTPRTDVSLGYFWSPDFQTHRDEHRLWQQLVYTHKFRKMPVNHQFRLEERFMEQASSSALRGRYLIRLVRPLGKKGWHWVSSNEVLVNLTNNNLVQDGFSQNRLFTGLRKNLAPNTFLEGGYMLLYANQSQPRPDQLNHVIVLRLNLNIGDFSEHSSNPQFENTPGQEWNFDGINPL